MENAFSNDFVSLRLDHFRILIHPINSSHIAASFQYRSSTPSSNFAWSRSNWVEIDAILRRALRNTMIRWCDYHNDLLLLLSSRAMAFFHPHFPSTNSFSCVNSVLRCFSARLAALPSPQPSVPTT